MYRIKYLIQNIYLKFYLINAVSNAISTSRCGFRCPFGECMAVDMSVFQMLYGVRCHTFELSTLSLDYRYKYLLESEMANYFLIYWKSYTDDTPHIVSYNRLSFYIITNVANIQYRIYIYINTKCQPSINSYKVEAESEQISKILQNVVQMYRRIVLTIHKKLMKNGENRKRFKIYSLHTLL